MHPLCHERDATARQGCRGRSTTYGGASLSGRIVSVLEPDALSQGVSRGQRRDTSLRLWDRWRSLDASRSMGILAETEFDSTGPPLWVGSRGELR